MAESENHTLLDPVELLRQIEALQEEKRKLISIVSHDVKSPLNRMYALIQLLQMEPGNLTEEQKNFLEKMHIVVADGLDMIRNLVDYRSIENNSIALFPEAVQLQSFIQSTVTGFLNVASKKGIKLMVESENILLHTDKHCLQRAVDTLLSNAIKFSYSGKKVWVRAHKHRDETALIEIEDEALGFKQNELPDLFQKFKKFTSRPTGGESSTGLGLFIAKSMIEKLGGKITCLNQEGVGSTFRLVVPVSMPG
ncbi:MAG TPA: HAMP domain-containing sensor histidine kinase [Cyclobacteriaceae bacterium]|nr:HAMP domain-containing sensor histidine kinase [Cyclobacteriaceae bacterium]HRJ80381.1 HAMP domain-containing sensor histidine kinase [Cyclobacteriaceae bacterium]